MESVLLFSKMIFVFPILLYLFSFSNLTNLNPMSWGLYVVLFPFLIIIFSLIIGIKLKLSKRKLFLLPLVIFLFLQLIPLPRSPYIFNSEAGGPPRHEPFAVGMGYPFSIIKMFQGGGCLVDGDKETCTAKYKPQTYFKLLSANPQSPRIKSGDVVLLPSGMILQPFNWLGMFLYTYVFWIIIIIALWKRSPKTLGH